DRIGRFVGERAREFVDVGVHWAAPGAHAPHPIKAEPPRIGKVAASRQSRSDGNAADAKMTAPRLARPPAAECLEPAGMRTRRLDMVPPPELRRPAIGSPTKYAGAIAIVGKGRMNQTTRS